VSIRIAILFDIDGDAQTFGAGYIPTAYLPIASFTTGAPRVIVADERAWVPGLDRYRALVAA